VIQTTGLAGAAARLEAGVEAIAFPPTIEELFRTEWGQLVGLARLLLDEPCDAEEVVQEAFTRLLAARAGLRDPDKAPVWLRSTVMNLARARLRRRAVALRHRSAPDPPASPADDEVLADDDRRRVVAVLRRLPLRQRQCLALRHWSGLTEREIAETLDISTGTVKQHVHRGMAVLADALREAE
jgi:RNA polymerase sigma-70 factor (sigma-E family)